ncbi:MAG TPA: ABC transporter ATP-binding protein [Spirochaetota bacterium]|nr:ABC transporter ATP-binding protein [Spirochaetota bacterium]HOM37770.1 ABC transporter ATP-binding protein [Spirochaetota bacterium]HPQ49353.1 ABC transporter ATP-binding protein [Spirochaetota bacterium]
MKVLEVKNLNVDIIYKNKKYRLIDNIDLNIKKGESLALIGESGCGKTITALSIPKLLSPAVKIDTNSSIILDGIELNKINDNEIRKIRGSKIGFVFQEPMTSLNPVFKVGDQIAEVLITHKKLDKREAKKQTIEIMKSLDLKNAEEIYDYYPHQLSGGMRQRIVICIAIACKPTLIIADEPTTSLDVTVQKQIMNIFRDLKEQGNSILFISHNLMLVKDFAHRTAIMYLGNIIEEGQTYDIFNKPLHPYTTKLLNAIPGPHTKKLEQIYGTVPSIENINRERCIFYDRCDKKISICSKKNPPVFEFDKRKVRCFLYEKS